MKARVDAPPLSSGYPAPAAHSAEDTCTFVLTSEAIEYITKQAKDDKPWALHLSLMKPHPPILVPEPYNSKYHPDDIELPAHRARSAKAEGSVHPFLAAEHSQKTQRPLVSAETGTVGDLSDSELRLVQSAYYGAISEVDDNIGRLMAALHELGVDENTLVIFTSDHGEMMGEHWLRGKIGFHDGSYHVPLIVADPSLQGPGGRGRVVHSFTEHVDIAPTVMDFMGLSAPRQFEGKSLRAFADCVDEPPPGWRSAAFFEYDYRFRQSGRALRQERGLDMKDCTICVMRTERRKLVHFGGGLPLLMFDLEKDPAELTDVSTHPQYSHEMPGLLSDMLSWRMRHADQTMTHVRLSTGGSVLRYDDHAGDTWEVSSEDPLKLAHSAKRPRVSVN